MTFELGFSLIAAVMLISAVQVVRTKNLIHAVLWLAVTLLATAALYARLDAPFLAGVQVLTYVGGIVTLTIFGVMVTRRHDGIEAVATTESPDRGFIFASALFAVLAIATAKSDLTIPTAAPVASAADLGRMLLDNALIAFEVLSLLLLAAIVGAIVLVRRRDSEFAPAKSANVSGLPSTEIPS